MADDRFFPAGNLAALPAALSPFVEGIAGTPGLAALLLVGSAARGDMDAHSDYDLVAVIADGAPWPKPFRDGGRETFPAADGRQVETMYTTAERLRRRMAEQAAQGTCTTAGFLSEGLPVCDRDGTLAQLQLEAQAVIKAGPPPLASADLGWECFHAWNHLKDVADRVEDTATARYLGFDAFNTYVQLFFRLHRRWLPRPKETMRTLREIDEDLFCLCEAFLTATSGRATLDALEAIAARISERFGVRFDTRYTSPAVESSR